MQTRWTWVEIFVTMENPEAGFTFLHSIKQAGEILDLGESKLCYCMHDGSGPKKPTVLVHNVPTLFKAYKDGKFCCEFKDGKHSCNGLSRHPEQVSSHQPGQSSLSRAEAAAYSEPVAKFWAEKITAAAKSARAERQERAARKKGKSIHLKSDSDDE